MNARSPSERATGGLVCVFSSTDRMAVQLAWSALDATGIPAHQRGAHLSPGLFGAGDEGSLWVAPRDAEQAAHVLGTERQARWVGGLSVAAPDEAGRLAVAGEPGEVAVARCPACREEWEPGFDVCWACGHAAR